MLVSSDEEKKARLVGYFEDTRRGTCEICMDNFEVGLNASRLPCLHVFHGACVGADDQSQLSRLPILLTT